MKVKGKVLYYTFTVHDIVTVETEYFHINIEVQKIYTRYMELKVSETNYCSARRTLSQHRIG